ncbi:GFA family protein [Sphingomonas sp. DT-204]|uniref:GFA family protein n=1 Tax=Sphingomonas sp. DT-204 TaxID=3396166 RepID=UPI003F1CEA98
MEGGCSCGTIRYRLASAPFDTGWCHCRICQQISGAPAVVFTSVPADDLVIESGGDALGTIRTTDFGERRFCTRCGTPISIRVDFQPETIDIPVATLDEPDRVPPGFHIFYDSRIAWAGAGDGLPRHARFRPDTRGLEPGQTES